MKNLNETNMEELNLNEMINVRGGDDTKTDDGIGGDVVVWE
jgi:hypothetical protein